jgi:hypothetical protein
MGAMKDVHVEESALEHEMELLGFEIDKLCSKLAAAMRVVFRHGNYSEYQRELDKPSAVRAF